VPGLLILKIGARPSLSNIWNKPIDKYYLT